MKLSRFALPLLVILASFVVWVPDASAFCGFYVAKADAKLYNQASQVAIARDGDRTVLTMANDYQGSVKDFAMVVPVPVKITEAQVNVGSPKIIERLDAFSAPRLVEYHDPNPCWRRDRFRPPFPGSLNRRSAAGNRGERPRTSSSLGVTVEAQFSVGEYDIEILSAKESDGLETWLRQNDYRIPQGASQLLQPYIRQKMKFFVAKVNLDQFDRSGFQSLRPLQIAYESPRFMLPIRLGMINARGEQDLIVYLMSPKGQTELTNYRTVKIPTNANIPVFVKDEFSRFYQDMFTTAHNKEGRKVAFLEYAWNMGGCDPCAANPLSPEELRQAGVFWLSPNFRRRGPNVFITRLHVRYGRSSFPEDLAFQETSNQQFFQGRYVMRHPFKGKIDCPAMEDYQRSLAARYEREARTLAELTGWNLDDIRDRQPPIAIEPQPWWRSLWPNR